MGNSHRLEYTVVERIVVGCIERTCSCSLSAPDSQRWKMALKYGAFYSNSGSYIANRTVISVNKWLVGINKEFNGLLGRVIGSDYWVLL